LAAQPEARAAYDRGDFAEAHELAHNVDTAAAQVLAARAAIAHALFGGVDETSVREWLERGLAAADRALSLDPDRPDALLAKAQARGEIALRSSALGNLNVAPELRELLERALALDPDDPDAMVAVGMWHVEIAARGVGWLYGADPEAGLERVAAGVERAPRRIDLRIEYATALQARGRHDEAAEQLAVALELPARNAFDRHQHARAEALQASWE
jgi:tetratricopeptide (TPR) repeat protein